MSNFCLGIAKMIKLWGSNLKIIKLGMPKLLNSDFFTPKMAWKSEVCRNKWVKIEKGFDNF